MGSLAERARHEFTAGASVSVGLALALILTGCIRGSGFEYVRNREHGTYFKVPETWRVYPSETVVAEVTRDMTEDRAARLRWAVTFDGSPRPSLDHFIELDAGATEPSGTAYVQTLTPEARESLSYRSLTDVILPVSEAVNAGRAELIDAEDLELRGGYRGRRVVFALMGEGGERFTIDQTALVDASTHHLYVFAIGCGRECFEDHSKVIEQVVDSWTVKER